jgi:hypothetical protein
MGGGHLCPPSSKCDGFSNTGQAGKASAVTQSNGCPPPEKRILMESTGLGSREACRTAPAAASTSPARRRGLWFGCATVAGFAVATFLPALNNDFVYDDFAFIHANPLVNTRIPNVPAAPWFRTWTEPYWPKAMSSDTLYRPLTTLSFRVNAMLCGDPLRARPFRVVNLALHALTSVGVVLLAWRLTSSATAGWLAGMLFATHPVHTEAVVPIYGRGDLLVGCFAVWLVVLHLRPPVEGRRSARRVVLCSVLLLAALMSKEHAIFVWPVLILIDLWYRRDPSLPGSARPLREWFNCVLGPSHAAYALAIAIFLCFRCYVFGWRTHLDAERTRMFEVPMAHVGLIEHVLTPFRLLWLVVTNITWPDSLCPVWSYPALSPARSVSPDVLAGMIVAAALFTLLIVLWHRRNVAGAMVAGILFTLAVPLQLVPVVRWFYAERWLYLPSIFMLVVFSWAMRRWGRLATLAGLAGALLLMPQSWPYSAAFASNLRMMHEVIVRQPDNFQGRKCYAAALWRDKQYPEAIQAANQMLERFGETRDAYLVLLRSYLATGDGHRALVAIDRYEALRKVIYEPALDDERKQAMQLIARSPASGPLSRATP